MNLQTQLSEIISNNDLNNTRFYQAWIKGELTKEALAAYADQYGRFIELIPQAWTTLGDEETANEEREHVKLWQRFATAFAELDLNEDIKEVDKLITEATEMFQTKTGALGALYAFEVQQPSTAKAKLHNLARYGVTEEQGEYFHVHTNNEHESEKLFEQISQLSDAEQQEVVASVKDMSQMLCMALDGIHDRYL